MNGQRMRGVAALITTLALTMPGMLFSSAHANGALIDGTYLCTTGAPSNLTPNYTITNSGVSLGASCVGAVVIPSGVTRIEDDAFENAFSLTSITLPSGLIRIGYDAFSGTGNLTSINIPASVTSIAETAFRITGITSFTVEAGNQNFSSPTTEPDAGVLFNNASTSIILYPPKKTDTHYSIPATVSSIESYAFENANLKSITIPSSVTSIGRVAFSNSALTNVTIPSSVTSIEFGVFYGTTSLTNITIPASVTSIGQWAFDGASSLTNITIPSSVTSIGDQAFQGATSLASVYFLGNAPASVGTTPFLNTAAGAKAYIKSGATGFDASGSPPLWNGLVVETLVDAPVPIDGQYVCSTGVLKTTETTNLYTITNGVVTDGGSWGGSCVGAVVIAPGVTSIGSYAFEYAYSMTSISIPASVTNIELGFNTTGLTSFIVAAGNQNYSSPTTGLSAGMLFNKSQTALISYPKDKIGTSYVIPAGVTSIGAEAFSSATALTSITIPSSVTSIGDGAFRDTGLTSFTVAAGNQNYSSPTSGPDSGVLFNESYTSIIAYPNEKPGSFYSIPTSVTSIEAFAFELTDVISITIPATVTSIGYAAFANADCTSIILQASITSIETGTFMGTKFTSFTIPASVTSIGNSAFAYSDALASITIPASVTSIGNYVFYRTTSLSSVYFSGNAPTVGEDAFFETPPGTKAYIKSGATGFTTTGSSALWNGLVIETVVDTPAPNVVTPTPTSTASPTVVTPSPTPTKTASTPLVPGDETVVIDELAQTGVVESPLNPEPVTNPEPTTTPEPTIDTGNADVVAFSPLDNPAEVADTAVTTLALAAAVAAAGAAGSVAGAAGSASGSGGSTSGSAGSGSGPGRTRPGFAGSRSGGGRASGSIETIKVELTGYESGKVGIGDKLRIWALPIVIFADKPSHNASVKTSRYSPLLSKLLIDGAHLRAMLGSLALLGSLLAIGLGSRSAIALDGEVLPPPALVLGIIAVIGAFDALAGFLGMFAFAITSLLLADERSAGDIRMLMGIVLLGFGPILLANSARNFRGKSQFTGDQMWERITDIAVGAFLAGWSAIAMVKVLPALAGLTLPIAESATDIGLAVAIATVIRIAAEQVAARIFPGRLKQLHPSKVHDSPLAQKIMALAFRAGVFFFVAAAFIGYEWYLVVGTLLFILPSFLGLFAHKFPNSPTMYQIIPTGIPGLIFNLALGAATVGLITSALGDDPLLAKLSFVLVPIPFFIIAVLSLIGREPHENDVRWYRRDRYKLLYRVGGTVAFFVVLKMTGILA